MRKDLRVPPPDVLALRAALLGGSYYLYAQYVASGVGPEGLLRGAEEASGLDLQVIVSIVMVSIYGHRKYSRGALGPRLAGHSKYSQSEYGHSKYEGGGGQTCLLQFSTTLVLL